MNSAPGVPAHSPGGDDPAMMFATARRLHQAGLVAEAEAGYRRVLAADPRHAAALHWLGVLAHQTGHGEAAVALIRQAVSIDDGIAHYHSSLGVVLHAQGQMEAAEEALGRALSIDPHDAIAWYNLGRLRQDRGDGEAAVAAYEAARGIDPTFAEAHNNLGNALGGLGRLEEAVAAYAAAARARPDYAEALSNLGNALLDLGRPEESVAAHRAALAVKPDFAGGNLNLGNALREIGRLDEAVAAYDAALRLAPDHVGALYNRGVALMDLGRLDESVAAYEAALRLRPDLHEAHSNLLVCLHYHPRVGDEAILAKARAFATRVETGRPTRSFANVADPDRRLRVGYVSADFKRHPVGYFLGPVLAGHDRDAVETFLYSNGRSADDLTARLRATADHWRSVAGLSDAAAAELIARDRIDLLIDLSGHTAHNRLPLFALKPAPVRATWLGFWGTTGLTAMDYILSDAVTIPPGEEGLYSERVLRLPGGRFCYGPPDHAPMPAVSPRPGDGGVVFGSFNNLAKIGPEVVELWAETLRAVPGSRLLLKWKSMNDEGVRRRLTEAFAAAGIEPERLTLRGASPHEAMLAEYGDMDVALDPFPFCGGLTSCEALWMGVPVVTLPGGTAPSRQTAGFLGAIGLTEWIARSPADYVAIARALASAPPRSAASRLALRERMRASPLCDGPGFTAGLERAFRDMWRRWCDARS